MSFTGDVKHELVRIKSGEIAELAALIRMNGTIQIINKSFALNIKLTMGDLARKVYSVIKKKFRLEIQIIVRKNYPFAGKHNIYELFLPPQQGLDTFLSRLGFIDDHNNIIFRIKDEFFSNRSYQRAYLRGAFLGGGSVNNPASAYHLEFRCEHRGLARDLLSLLASFNLEGRLTEHNNKHIVYFKNYEDITTILNIIGAHHALLEMENIYVVKSLKNDINRKINFETANMDKTITAALEQIEDIELIEATRGISSLPASLQEIAYLRKEYPYASLKELGDLLSPKISKSGVNHRMRRIKKVADEIRVMKKREEKNL
ncbi:MAG TPA: DNA-binding protein WhiA [Halanaerobiaceae bacterium]|nr:DNA-binding protein WhiA [Halanaerobiaceae bacterium]HOA39874.1 DNA-binding protein WhiA [Halanaerobiales bacterium]HPZ61949.1 DNA-binding protein WhiA [Halanaerobiales bacterium]HQD03328.1 DNA-binding protein WhiA [Halanaerobiales bacterium]